MGFECVRKVPNLWTSAWVVKEDRRKDWSEVGGHNVYPRNLQVSWKEKHKSNHTKALQSLFPSCYGKFGLWNKDLARRFHLTHLPLTTTIAIHNLDWHNHYMYPHGWLPYVTQTLQPCGVRLCSATAWSQCSRLILPLSWSWHN